MTDNYEAQVEAALAYIKLQENATEQEKRANAKKALLAFLESHPDFKAFYILYEGAH